MIKNGKKFVEIPDNFLNIKELLNFLMNEGVGLPVRKNDPDPKWTRYQLLDRVNECRHSDQCIDLRTIQNWLQMSNSKGIGAENRMVLAKIFGCGDPDLTHQLRVEFQKANKRLTDQRRNLSDKIQKAPWLILQIDRLFSLGSRYEVSVSVFVFCVALCFMAYVFGVHDIMYSPEAGLNKQVGFFWAPNWFLVGLVLLPLYLKISCEALYFWKTEGRTTILPEPDVSSRLNQWNIELSKYHYVLWINLITCVLFVFLFQWGGIYLSALISGDIGEHVIDWSLAAIFSPDDISVVHSIFLTFCSYLHTGMNSFLYLAGLTILFAIFYDFFRLSKGREQKPCKVDKQKKYEIIERMGRLLYGAVVLGLLIIICIKLQAVYLLSNSENIVVWLLTDARVIAGLESSGVFLYERRSLANFTSFILLIVTAGVLISCQRILGNGVRSLGTHVSSRLRIQEWLIPNVTIALLVIIYFLIGNFTGFSVVFLFGLILSGIVVYKSFESA